MVCVGCDTHGDDEDEGGDEPDPAVQVEHGDGHGERAVAGRHALPTTTDTATAPMSTGFSSPPPAAAPPPRDLMYIVYTQPCYLPC